MKKKYALFAPMLLVTLLLAACGNTVPTSASTKPSIPLLTPTTELTSNPTLQPTWTKTPILESASTPTSPAVMEMPTETATPTSAKPTAVPAAVAEITFQSDDFTLIGNLKIKSK